jgi:phage-related minor tail protein
MSQFEQATEAYMRAGDRLTDEVEQNVDAAADLMQRSARAGQSATTTIVTQSADNWRALLEAQARFATASFEFATLPWRAMMVSGMISGRGTMSQPPR